MTFNSLFHLVRRRWISMTCGLIVTALLCVGCAILVPPTYGASAGVLLLPPKSTLGTQGNPYRALGGLEIAADVLSRAMLDSKVADSIAPPSGSASFEVAPDPTTSGPVLLVEGTDRSPSGALRTEKRVLEQMPRTLASLQEDAGAGPETLITMAVITQDKTAQTTRKSQIRALIVAVVIGLGFTLGLMLLADRRRSGSSRHRRFTNSSKRMEDGAERLASDSELEDDGLEIRRPSIGRANLGHAQASDQVRSGAGTRRP